MKKKQQSPIQKSKSVRTPTKKLPIDRRTPVKRSDPPKPQVGGRGLVIEVDHVTDKT